MKLEFIIPVWATEQMVSDIRKHFHEYAEQTNNEVTHGYDECPFTLVRTIYLNMPDNIHPQSILDMGWIIGMFTPMSVFREWQAKQTPDPSFPTTDSPYANRTYK